MVARRHRGSDDDGCHGVRDGGNGEARSHVRAVAGRQRLAGGGDGVGIVAAHPLRAQAGKLGREDQEAMTGERARKRDQPRIVTAFRRHARDQEQRRPRIGRQVEITRLAGERHRSAHSCHLSGGRVGRAGGGLDAEPG